MALGNANQLSRRGRQLGAIDYLLGQVLRMLLRWTLVKSEIQSDLWSNRGIPQTRCAETED